ncbi:MAG TPA: sialidase family protein [Anaerolineae bacterium]
MKRRFIGSLIEFAVVLLISSTVNPISSSAQSALSWSAAQRIRGYANDSDPPFLVADQNKTVHAFNSQWVGGDLAVLYSQWSPGKSWTTPVDILLSPKARQATVQGIFLDSKGILHLIFFGGTEFDADIYYSRAPAVSAANAGSWSPPKSIGTYAGKLISASLVGDNQGDLFVVYSGNRDGNGLYAVQSSDGGASWSSATTIFLTDSTSLWAYAVKTALDPQGTLHAVWTVKNRLGLGEAVYYAHLEAGQKQWTLPMTLQTVRGGDYQADWASIIYYKNELFVLYDYSSPSHRWMRRSKDGGRTWTDPVIAFTSRGEYGHPVLLIDGSNTLHAILGNRTDDERLHGMWHTTWRGDHWDAVDPVVSGPMSPQFDPNRPQAVVSQGNIILVTWRTDPGLTPNGIWFSYATLDAPEWPVVPLPTAVATTAPTVTPIKVTSIEPTPSATARPVTGLQTNSPPTPIADTSPATGVVLGILPAGFLLLVVIVMRRLR